MDENFQIELQAYFDGELAGRRADEVRDRLAGDAEVRALHDELRNTREALAGYESGFKLPESRGFYWAKIAREIERGERTAPMDSSGSRFRIWRRFLLPAAALAALILAAFWAGSHRASPATPELEVAMAGSDPFTYRDYSSGTTLVWLSYPAENDLADIQPDDSLD